MKHSSLQEELSKQNVTIIVFEKLSQFSSTAFKPAKGDSYLSFHYRRKIQIHCRVLKGGPIPLKGLTAELHCSCRLYLLMAQGLEEP